jgi:succinoglycan biosynthesis transport protein ExoP
MYMTPVNPQEARSTSTAPQLPLRPSSKGPALKINVVKSLRLHAVSAVLVALIILGLGLAVLLRRGVSYVAESTIYVSPTFPKTLIEDREQEYPYDSYVQQQVHSITRYDVMEDALHQLPQEAWKRPGETDRAAIDRLQKNLDIKRVGLTYQVSITLHRSTPDHLADVVNAVTQSYLAKAKDEEFYGRDDRLSTLRGTRDDLRKDLDTRIEELSGITKALGVAAIGTEGPNPFDDQLAKMRTDLTTAHEQRVQAEAELSSLKNSDPSVPNAALNAAADELIASDPGLLAMKADLAKKRSALVEQLSTLTPNHPLRKQTEDQLAQINRSLQDMQTDLRRKAAARLETKDRADLNRTSAIEAKLASDLQHETNTATSAAPKLQRAEELKAEITRLQARYAEVDDRISNLELESSSPGSIHLFAAALPPTGPESSKLRFLILALFPISALFGIAVAVAFDVFDPYIHTASDMEALLGFAPIGVLLDDRDITQRVFDECSLRLAAGIDHAVRSAGSRTFIVTGVASGAGTTSIVQTLGSTLARLGHKTLTIDASGNTDPIAYVTLGVNDNLTEPKQEPHFESTDHLQSTSPVQLQTSAIFPQSSSSNITPFYSFAAKTFQKLTTEYDVILMDTAPLLISAETEYLARAADVTILVAEAGKTSKRKLTRCTRLLERLDISGVASVINKVRLLRAETDLQQDLRESETRLNEMNLRWRPHRHSSHVPAPHFDQAPEESMERETMSFATNGK